ncbi:hypothetical protein [Polaribacter sp. Asnod1-A03]|uniref:hypothetical protein n=1 Tax=Polaribacter sp. Asnod1-A03 TaxID=3160581 RepID=UPI00386F3250
MVNLSHSDNQIQCVSNFENLIRTSFQGKVNALCWNRKLDGDFFEIIEKSTLTENITLLHPDELSKLPLSKQGQLARNIILEDYKLLKAFGASPSINIIKHYDRDDVFPYFPTDVYSFHVDKSPIPTDTFLCTYHGNASEIVANSKADQKIQIPEIRNELRKLHDGKEEDFDAFLSEFFFDLHYQPKKNVEFTNLGVGNLWKLATKTPESNVLPCIHRAPIEKNKQYRLLLIC